MNVPPAGPPEADVAASARGAETPHSKPMVSASAAALPTPLRNSRRAGRDTSAISVVMSRYPLIS
ncbi:hypothetical protein [Trinickia symbiotica]|uniref:hypothetical protein n=1 Tax=Trinickia symbiotica TaxID=863227 RepID=UPI0021591A8D|nr:hypothetical protein [Trinickia symbiotica]